MTNTQKDLMKIRKILEVHSSNIPHWIDTKLYIDKSVWEHMKEMYIVISKLSITKIIPNQRMIDIYIEYKRITNSLEIFCDYKILYYVEEKMSNDLDGLIESSCDYELYEMAHNFNRLKNLIEQK